MNFPVLFLPASVRALCVHALCARHLRGAESAWSLPTIVRALFCSLGLFALPAVSQTTINGVMVPLSLDFGTVPVGATSAAKTVSFVNTSIGMQVVTDTSNYNGASSGDFAIGPCNGSGGISHALFSSGNACTYTVTFTPTAAGSRSGTLRFNADMSGQFSIPVTGTGITPVTPASSIVIDPATPATLYSGLDGAGVYKSTDSGTNWTAATTQPANTRVKALAIKPGDGSKLYAATYGGGAFKSSDSGANWSACATQPTNLNLLSLTMDAAGKLYAGSEAGVFVSSDACASWAAMNTGLPN